MSKQGFRSLRGDYVAWKDRREAAAHERAMRARQRRTTLQKLRVGPGVVIPCDGDPRDSIGWLQQYSQAVERARTYKPRPPQGAARLTPRERERLQRRAAYRTQVAAQIAQDWQTLKALTKVKHQAAAHTEQGRRGSKDKYMAPDPGTRST